MNQGALLIDLRPPEPFAAGHVDGARLMNGEQILKAAETLKRYKEKVVVVYDDTGSLARLGRQLAAQGFTRAFNLRGGVTAWRADNLPLTKDPSKLQGLIRMSAERFRCTQRAGARIASGRASC